MNWNGGTNISDLRPQDRTGWAFVISIGGAVEPGFAARWDGKVEPQEPVVDAESRSFGAVKSEF